MTVTHLSWTSFSMVSGWEFNILWSLHQRPCACPQRHQMDLIECSSAWKSARDNMPLVEELVKSEMEAGFVALVQGGVDSLKPNTTKLRLGSLAWSWLKVAHPDWLWIVQFRMSPQTPASRITSCSQRFLTCWSAPQLILRPSN